MKNPLAFRRQKEAKQEASRLEGDLGRAVPGLKDLTVTSEELKAVIPDTVTVVEYLRYAHLSPDPTRQQRVVAEPRMLAFVVQKGRDPVCVPLPGTANALAARVGEWFKLLQQSEPSPYPPKLNAAAAQIADIVWRPLEPHLGNPRLVVVCPDGPLVRFPFAALPGKQPKSYLIDDLALSYAVSGRQVKQMFLSPAPSAAPLGRGALVVAGIEYPPGKLGDLRGTLPFGLLIKGLFEKSFPGEPVSLLSGPGVTRDVFLGKLAESPRVISLVVHGESPPVKRPLASGFLRLVPPVHESLEAMLDTKLLFAAADDPRTGGRPTVLTGLEFAWEVRNPPQFLGLWCCGGADGWETFGDGPLNFIRAGHLAGAETVVASLWPKEDMDHALGEHGVAKRFHEYVWQPERPGMALALCQAQRDHRAWGGENAHPRSWAGWILSGNIGEGKEPRPILALPMHQLNDDLGYYWAILGIVAVLFVVVALWIVRNRWKRPRKG